MKFRIKYSTPFYILQERKKFLWFYYWKTLYVGCSFQYIEHMYKEITQTVPDWNKKHGTN